MSTLGRPIIDALVQSRAPTLNHAQLLGGWRNTDAGAGGGILRLIVAEDGGALRVRFFGAGRRGPYDWGEIQARSYAATPTSTTAWAFTATVDFGFLHTTISAYTKTGILILTSYNSFVDERGRAPYWTREFFYRDQDASSPAGTPGERSRSRGLAEVTTPPSHPYGELTRERDRLDGAAGRLPAPRVDLTPLIATWRSFDIGSTRVARVQITECDGRLLVRPHGSWTPRRHEWHEAVGTAFTEDVRRRTAAAFTATYDLYHCHVEMVGQVNRRLLTIQTGNTFVDGSGQSPYYTREHFYPS